jgi:TPR repeat protein
MKTPTIRFPTPYILILIILAFITSICCFSRPSQFALNTSCSSLEVSNNLSSGNFYLAQNNLIKAFPHIAIAALCGSSKASKILNEPIFESIPNRTQFAKALMIDCENGYSASCFSSAILSRQNGANEAVSFLSSACDNNDIAACRELGRAFLVGRWSIPKNANKAIILYRKSCDAGDMWACTNLGVCYDTSEMEDPPDCGLSKDIQKAVALYQKSCNGGDAWGCGHLASCYDNGCGTLSENHSLAKELWSKACSLGGSGSLRSCVNYGLTLKYDSMSTASDIVHACELFKKACDGDDLHGCTKLGVCFEEGNIGDKVDIDRAMQCWQKACDGSEFGACVSMATHYYQGTLGINKNEKLACELFQKACDGANMLGCALLGDCYARGKDGFPANSRKSCELYEKSCNGGEMLGCAVLGACFVNGIGGWNVNPQYGCELFMKACKGDFPLGCENLLKCVNVAICDPTIMDDLMCSHVCATETNDGRCTCK